MKKPWFNRPPKLKCGAHIAIIGGGVGGVTLLYHLRNAGYKTTLIEKEPQILSGSSGNPAAILDPYLSLGESIEKSFYLKAYGYALKFYKELNGDIFQACDLFKLKNSKNKMERFERLSQNYDNNFLTLTSKGLTCSPSGYVKPLKMQNMFNGSDDIRNGISVNRIELLSDKKWALYDKNNDQVLQVDAIVIANSYLSRQFNQTKKIEFDSIAGQISLLAPQYKENNILCSEGYVTPIVSTEIGDANICGATFEKNIALEITEEAHLLNLSKSPFKFNNQSVIGGRRGIRAMTNDHLPISGPVPNFPKYEEKYRGLDHGPHHKKFPLPSYHPNLFINVGLGARGFLSAPILAKHITALICGGKSPLEEKTVNSLHPGRFIIRSLSKK